MGAIEPSTPVTVVCCPVTDTIRSVPAMPEMGRFCRHMDADETCWVSKSWLFVPTNSKVTAQMANDVVQNDMMS